MTREDDSAEVTEPGLSEVYVEPQPLPKVSDHKTLELDTVKLSDEIDPRKRPTELKLGRVRRRPPPEPEAPVTPPEGMDVPELVTPQSGHARLVAGALGLLVLCIAAFLLARTLRSHMTPPVTSAAASAPGASKPPPALTAPAAAAPSGPSPALAAAAPSAPLPNAPAPVVAPLVSAPQLPQKAGAPPHATKPVSASAHAASGADPKTKHSIY